MAVAGHQATRSAAELATISPGVGRAVDAMGAGPLTEDALRQHVFPLFSRVLKRSELYFANHSLGRPLDQTADDIREFTDRWYAQLDDAWGPWLDEINAFRARYALLMGLDRADTVVPKSSAGHALRTVIGALPNPRPTIVATRGEFDSNDFVFKVYASRQRANIRWVDPRSDGLFHAEDIVRSIRTGPAPDLVCVSHVYYATGQLLDVAPIAAAAHAAGAISLLDCYHSTGVIPFAAPLMDFDFAIGGSYKYIRGGPGPCYLAIHPRHLDTPATAPATALRPIDTGWFAKKDTFGFRRPEEPLFSDGGDAWLEATPLPVLAYQARAGLQLILAIGVQRLREYSLRQQGQLATALKSRGVAIRELSARGAFLLVPSADADALTRTLKSKGLNTDSRLGHVRMCPDILTTGADIDRAAEIVAGSV